MQRSRLTTEKRLIDAVDQLIAEEGLDQIGINRVSSQSGINKVLIYRYFGGLDGLLKAYFERVKPIISVPPLDLERMKDASLEEIFNACYEYVIDEFRQLRQNVPAQEFLKADLFNNEGVQSLIAERKTAMLQQVFDTLSKMIQTSNNNGRSFAAICIFGMTMLTFMAQQKRSVLGIDVSTDEGWAQIESALKTIFNGAYLMAKERLEASQETLS